MEKKYPRVGMGVFVLKDGKFLLGKRKNTHGAGHWQLPGGHLEFNEKFEDCAKREVLEEAGVKIKNIRLCTVTNDIFKKEGKHYITIFMISDWQKGTPKTMEPDKCEGWIWVTKETAPKPLFLPLNTLLKKDLF
ncbi:ADP-ribose pyrophosphatase [Thermoplasmatales archaeon SCGC AB-539-C06]|nr:ADP-ribose pyrophosphatase [Thermoplasmatales archaeon SCGC AB-539-C06]ENO12478.1 ADP-ribose pyrophosphatase [Thermoplasmatales archaeon SCGC AB-539-C06]